MRTALVVAAAHLLWLPLDLWAAPPWAPEPEQLPQVYLDGQSIVVNLSWDYPNYCFDGVGFNRIGTSEPPTISPDGLLWNLHYSFFGTPSGCRSHDPPRWVGSEQYVWTNLAPGTHRVKVSYVDASSYLDCQISPLGCPLPVVTRVFIYDVVVPVPAVPAYANSALYALIVAVGIVGGATMWRRPIARKQPARRFGN